LDFYFSLGKPKSKKEMSENGKMQQEIKRNNFFEICMNMRTWIRSNPLLVTILIAAFALRVSTITWGLPFGFSRQFHPDEMKYLHPALDFWGYFGTTKPFPMYGTSLQYTVGMMLWPIQWTGEQLEITWVQNQTFGWLFCRFVVVLLGTVGVFLVYKLGERLFSKEVGVLAAALLAVSPYHALNSSWFTLDVPMSVLLTGVILLTIRLKERQGLGDYALIGCAFGYMIGMKFVSGIFLIIPLMAILIGWWPHQDLKRVGKGLLLCAGIGTVVFCLLNPQYFLGFEKILSYVLKDKHDFFDRAKPENVLMVIRRVWSSYNTSLGTPVVILAVLGMLTFDRNQWRLKVPLIIFLLAYTLSFGHFLLPRYIIFVAPIFCLFAAKSCMILFKNKHTVVRVIGVTATCLVMVYSATVSIIGTMARYHDPRVDAARFIAVTYPETTKIGLTMISEEYMWAHRWRHPHIANEKNRVVSILDNPDIIVTSSLILNKIEKALTSPHLRENYIWNSEENRMWYRYSPPSPRLFAFYDNLLHGDGYYRLLKVFPRPISAGLAFPPPEIRIYERAPG
jgi:hypothetical protein